MAALTDVYIGTAGWAIPGASSMEFAGSGTHLQRYARGLSGRMRVLDVVSDPDGPGIGYVHLVLLDLDGSGYPALIYALPGSRTLVVHPQVGRTLGAEPIDLLVSLDYDDRGTKDDESDDIGPFIDRYRVDL